MNRAGLLSIWILVFICGGGAIAEVIINNGSWLALCMILVGLALIIYILYVPSVNDEKDT